MDSPVVNPVHWPAKYLMFHGEDVIHELALKSAATLGSYRLVLGRCLLAVGRTRLFEKFSCSGAVHYACLVLGLSKAEARTLRRVAHRLEELPRLSMAAELGRLPWGKLREIVRKATSRTEEFWLDLASRMSYHDIERLVRATEFGKLPWEECENSDDPGLRMHLCMTPETNEMFKRAVNALSRKLDKALSPAETLEHLLADYLTKQPVSSDLARAAKKEAERDVAAAKHSRARLVMQAWIYRKSSARVARKSRHWRLLSGDRRSRKATLRSDPHGPSRPRVARTSGGKIRPGPTTSAVRKGRATVSSHRGEAEIKSSLTTSSRLEAK